MADRRRERGTPRNRSVGPPPNGGEDRTTDRRQHEGTPADRGRFHATRQEITLPTWVAYAVIAVGVLVVIAFGSNRLTGVENEQDAILESRVQSTSDFCRELNANALRANAFGDFIAGLIMAGSILPGDKVVQYDVTGLPSRVRAGPLSRDFQKRYGLPSAQARLTEARMSVAKIHKLRRPQIDCAKLVRDIRADAAAA